MVLVIVQLWLNNRAILQHQIALIYLQSAAYTQKGDCNRQQKTRLFEIKLKLSKKFRQNFYNSVLVVMTHFTKCVIVFSRICLIANVGRYLV